MGLLFFWQRLNDNRHVKKVTGTKITAFYATLSVLYAAIQIIFLAATWQINHGVGREVESIVEASGTGRWEFSYLDTVDGELSIRLCARGITYSMDLAECPVIFPLSKSESVQDTNTGFEVSSSKKEFDSVNQTLSLESYVGLRVNGKQANGNIELNKVCLDATKWTYHHLLMVRREDVISMCFQAWLFLMSALAIFQESIPHIGASFFLHLIALAWSSFQIYATKKFEDNYKTLIIGSAGACGSVDLIADYFPTRMAFQIGTEVINFVSLIASAYLTYRLIDHFGWATFKKMGASRTIDHAYKAALALSICIQLAIFFYVASVGTYLDLINKRLFGADPELLNVYVIGYGVTTVLVIPWLYLAWYGIRREAKFLMYGFFFLSILYLGCSFGLFKSNTFRQTFVHWMFAALMYCTSYLIISLTVVLAIFCLWNFDKGLPHYFERRHEEDDFLDGFHPTPDVLNDSDVEKVAFPPTSEDATVIAFPSNTAPVYLRRTETATSGSSVGSTRLPPMQLANPYNNAPRGTQPRLTIPTKAAQPVGRSLTTSSRHTAATDSPSWTPGDDAKMMNSAVRRFDSTSSWGNGDSADLDREFSFGTVASSNGYAPSQAPPRNAVPKRTATASSTSSTRTYTSRKRIDLGEEL